MGEKSKFAFLCERMSMKSVGFSSNGENKSPPGQKRGVAFHENFFPLSPPLLGPLTYGSNQTQPTARVVLRKEELFWSINGGFFSRVQKWVGEEERGGINMGEKYYVVGRRKKSAPPKTMRSY